MISIGANIQPGFNHVAHFVESNLVNALRNTNGSSVSISDDRDFLKVNLSYYQGEGITLNGRIHLHKIIDPAPADIYKIIQLISSSYTNPEIISLKLKPEPSTPSRSPKSPAGIGGPMVQKRLGASGSILNPGKKSAYSTKKGFKVGSQENEG